MNKNVLLVSLISVVGFETACQKNSHQTDSAQIIKIMPSPAKANSGSANLNTSEIGNLYLSWLEPTDDDQIAFRFSRFEANQWSSPGTVATGDNWIAYWAELPSIHVLRGGTLAAHWIGQATHLYDVNLAFSSDRGTTWSAAISPHRDGTDTEHGFVSLLPWQNDLVLAVWLDGRKHDSDYSGPGKDETALRFATISPAGELFDKGVLDPRVCDCCPTAAAVTTNGAIVAYRDRSEGEVRDISFVRREKDYWTEPTPVHEDQWQINGCPVNGPAVTARREKVAVAWFTSSNDQAAVKISFSEDGENFAAPIRADNGKPLGNVAVLLLENGDAIVAWMEGSEKGADFLVRRVSPDGSLGKSTKVNNSGAATGMPRIARAGNNILFAWTAAGPEKRVLTARAKLELLE